MQASGPEVLEFGEIETPKPGPGEVLVDVEAAGVNFIDTYRRSGVYRMEYPHVVGVEGTGSIAEVGEGIESWQVGDRVAWHEGPGSYATQVVVNSDFLLRVPEGVSSEVAAAMPLQGLTAQYLATSSHEIKPGQTSFVHAGAGGVGLFLTQIIKHLGGNVISTVSTDEKAELSRKAGADEVFLYGEGVDVAYDGVGKDTFDASLSSIKPLGSMVLFGGAPGSGAAVRHSAPKLVGRNRPVPSVPSVVRPQFRGAREALNDALQRLRARLAQLPHRRHVPTGRCRGRASCAGRMSDDWEGCAYRLIQTLRLFEVGILPIIIRRNPTTII